jgi:hypothetical protein
LVLMGSLPCNSMARSVGLDFSKAPAPTKSMFLVSTLSFWLTEIDVPSRIGSRSYYTPSSEALEELPMSPLLTNLSSSSMTTMALVSSSALMKLSKSIF